MGQIDRDVCLFCGGSLVIYGVCFVRDRVLIADAKQRDYVPLQEKYGGVGVSLP